MQLSFLYHKKKYSWRDMGISTVTAILASAFLAFGMYHVHSISRITEGGVLGATLLLEHWFHISPSISNFVMNAICYVMGWRLFGKWFIFCSAVASTSFSVTYGICEQFPPPWPQIAQHPLIASLVGACFVGIGAGLCVRVGGAAGGDDALAMSLSHLTHWKIQTVYLLTDFVVLVLSLSYIPFQRIIYSILTVLLSGQIIGLIQRLPLPLPAMLDSAADKRPHSADTN